MDIGWRRREELAKRIPLFAQIEPARLAPDRFNFGSLVASHTNHLPNHSKSAPAHLLLFLPSFLFLTFSFYPSLVFRRSSRPSTYTYGNTILADPI
jgi:hypothetical protein